MDDFLSALNRTKYWPLFAEFCFTSKPSAVSIAGLVLCLTINSPEGDEKIRRGSRIFPAGDNELNSTAKQSFSSAKSFL